MSCDVVIGSLARNGLRVREKSGELLMRWFYNEIRYLAQRDNLLYSFPISAVLPLINSDELILKI